LRVTYPGDGQTGWGGQSGQGEWGQSNYPPSGGFPQQSYNSGYGGLGVFSGGEPEPPKKNKTWLIVGVVAVVLLIAGGVTAFVLTRSDKEQPVANPTVATTTTTEPTAEQPAGQCEGLKSGWTCVPVTELSYSYSVPKAWKPVAGKGDVNAMPDVKLIGLTSYGEYKCGGKDYNRGSTGGVVVPQTDLGAVAKDFATKLSEQYYKPYAPTYNATVSEPKPVKIQFDGKAVEGVQVDSTIVTSGSDCLATKGLIKILVLKGSKGFHVFMANGDIEGGPATPAVTTEADLQAMVDSVMPIKQG
jgi:hypothetical protein